MSKKLTLFGAAIAALAAFALPAVASAAPVLTSANNPGTPIPVKQTIKGTSTNAVTTGTAVGTLSCEHVEIFGVVEVNDKTNGADGKGTGGATKNCKFGPEGKVMTVTAPTLKTLKTTTSGVAEIEMTYIADVGPVECHFEGKGTATYTTGVNSLLIKDLVLTATSPLCGGSGIKFNATFKLFTTDGTDVIVSAG